MLSGLYREQYRYKVFVLIIEHSHNNNIGGLKKIVISILDLHKK